MALDPKEMAKSVAKAMFDVLGKDIPGVAAYVRSESKKLALALENIEKLASAGKINERQAKSFMEVHELSTEILLTSVKEITEVTARKAINAGLGAVAAAINAALPFKLLPEG